MNNESFLCEPYCVCCRRRRRRHRFSPAFCFAVNYARGFTLADGAKGQSSFCCLCAVFGSRGLRPFPPNGYKRVARGKPSLVRDVNASAFLSTQKLLPTLNRIVSCCAQARREKERKCAGIVILPSF
jgi:hypothetical protein